MQTRAAAIAYERELLVELHARSVSGVPEPPTRPPLTFSGFMEQYCALSLSRLRASSQYATKSTLRVHHIPFFGAMRLTEINALAISAFAARQKTLGLAPKTINNQLSMLRCVLAAAHDWEFVQTVPKIPWVDEPEPRTRCVSSEETHRIIDAATPEFWRPFIAFLVYTGVRFGEAAALRWQNLELDGPEPVVHIREGAARRVVGATKTGKERDVPLVPTLVRELRAFRHDRPHVFCRPADGQILDPAGVRRNLHRICDRAGVPRISWHVFRHTFAMELTVRRVPTRTVQRLLGHSDIRMTERYLKKIPPAALRESVMLLDGGDGAQAEVPGEKARAHTPPNAA